MAENKKIIYRCPYCEYKYNSKDALYGHMEKQHKDQLNGLSPAQAYFNYKYKKDGGKCIICKGPTKWNEATEKYERLCSDACKKKYRKLFQERMKNKGKDGQMKDPNHQKKMLAARKISGVYVWKDGTKTPYVGSYERDFLEFIETMLPNFNPSDIMGPAPQVFYYMYKGEKHFYIPDFYITSLNLIIQIKSAENKHYRERDIEKELAEDAAVDKTQYNYIKIYDKDYEEFYDFILNFDFQKTK